MSDPPKPIITHNVAIHSFGCDFAAINGDTVEIIHGILHINGHSTKEMAESMSPPPLNTQIMTIADAVALLDDGYGDDCPKSTLAEYDEAIRILVEAGLLPEGTQ